MVAVTGAGTNGVVMLNVGDTVAFAGTVTEAGTTAAGLSLVNCTTAPPAGAFPVNVTVFPVAGDDPNTDAETTVSTESAAGVIVRVDCLLTPL